MRCIVDNVPTEAFWHLADAKLLPDDFDYAKQLDCYHRRAPLMVNQ